MAVNALHNSLAKVHTLIHLAKTCNFESNISDFNSVDLKNTQKLSKAKFEDQRPKNSNFIIFSVIWVNLQTIVQKKSLV